MGCWNETCMLTNLPILPGDNAVGVLIARNNICSDTCYADSVFVPITLPLFGSYNDYGGLEDIEYNPAALAPLHDSDLYVGQNCKTAIQIQAHKNLGPAEWEKSVAQIFDAARQCELHVLDSHEPEDDLLRHVQLILMRREFFNFAVNAKIKEFPPNHTKDPSFYIRFRGGMRFAIQNARVPDKDLRALAALTAFMNMSRIAWHPTCGTGSQNTVGTPAQAKFYEMMAEKAARLFLPPLDETEDVDLPILED